MALPDQTADAISRKPLPSAFVQRPDLIAKWIVDVVPCLTARSVQSQKDTDAVVRHLRRRGVPNATIVQALSLSGYQFSFKSSETGMLQTLMYLQSRQGPPQTSMSPLSEGDERSSMIYTARVLEQKYRVAMAGHSATLMKAILKALVDLLVANGTKDSDRSITEDEDKTQKLREEILRNAPTAGRAIKLGGPGQGPPRGRGRLQKIGPMTYAVIDEELVEEEAAEGEGEGEGEAD